MFRYRSADCKRVCVCVSVSVLRSEVVCLPFEDENSRLSSPFMTLSVHSLSRLTPANLHPPPSRIRIW